MELCHVKPEIFVDEIKLFDIVLTARTIVLDRFNYLHYVSAAQLLVRQW